MCHSLIYMFVLPLWLLGGELIVGIRNGSRETRKEAIALGRQEVTAVWTRVGGVEGESEGLAWQYPDGRFWAGGKERARVPHSAQVIPSIFSGL